MGDQLWIYVFVVDLFTFNTYEIMIWDISLFLYGICLVLGTFYIKILLYDLVTGIAFKWVSCVSNITEVVINEVKFLFLYLNINFILTKNWEVAKHDHWGQVLVSCFVYVYLCTSNIKIEHATPKVHLHYSSETWVERCGTYERKHDKIF